MVNNKIFRSTGVRKLFGIFAAALLLISSANANAVSWPKSPHVDATSWAVVDARSGQVVAVHNADQELPPASLTKMMTLYLAFEEIKLGRLDLNARVTVSNKAWKIGGSTMFLEPRIKPTVKEILHGIATLSGNDACIALAEHIDGSEGAFAQRMNAKAKQLGLENSHFANATGFPQEGHYSSAMDMAKLGAALWRDFPDMYELFGEKSYTFDGRTQPNRNRLLWSYPDADGIKTGHTEEAGYCLVGSAEKNTTRFVASVFGASSDRSRAQQTKALLTFSFRNFVTMRPSEREIRRQVEVFEGTEGQIWLKPTDPIWVTVPKGNESALSFRLRYDAPLKAPIREGEKLGTIEALFGDSRETAEVLKSVDMVSTRQVDRASWVSRQWDGIRLWWRDDSSDEGSVSESQ
ncbi:D-alanyl-D-alanine carboxypeptidase (penicillin-binding protein 5/6) [Mariprofundus aestuarium]|uniref:serine-type D-Ala-D-Ala carboxypeptidase n=1 Tax=Mariprofundus aestuarium TaxID=1921086 RepID=A0A2K8L228_MARES|nr:D-alanyl-D-alanine carboxypeptidase family protein [Mariprofundus aestuarium]ATX79891.1 D-alanyl-D-alanine carboxypeptidase (penicillin-binding protein 5/6) [Mariprofundus aestuarium]